MTKLAQTYLYRPDGAWFISTANRRSSAVECPEAEYAETLVWTLDEGGTRDKIIWQGSDAVGAITTHLDVVTTIYRTGKLVCND